MNLELLVILGIIGWFALFCLADWLVHCLQTHRNWHTLRWMDLRQLHSRRRRRQLPVAVTTRTHPPLEESDAVSEPGSPWSASSRKALLAKTSAPAAATAGKASASKKASPIFHV